MFSFYEQNDQLPTKAVIAEHFGYASPNAAHEHVDCLERRGLIERNALNKFKFTEAGRRVALAGRVPA
jgi:SOS-response transcriptional repressor LexA